MSLRYLMYETNGNSQYPDYAVVVSIINDKMINVNLGGEKDLSGNLIILESVMIQGSYIPKIGDWITIHWDNGQPIAVGSSGSPINSGLVNINNDVKIIAQTDITNDIIVSSHITAFAIQAEHISANSVTAYAISSNTITGDKIVGGTISGNLIAANTISGNLIKAGTISGNLIAANTISGGNIIAGSINSSQISAGSITGDRIQSGSITSTQISAGSISADRISANSITSTQIKAGSVTGDSISGGTISGNLIAASAIVGTHIGANQITGDKISAKTISGNNIAANTISGGNILASTISGGNIIAGSITGDRLSANTITSSQISAGSITGDRISGGTITGDLISSNTISGNLIKAGTISGNLIAANTISGNLIQAGTISGNLIAANSISGNQIVAGSISGNLIAANTISGGNIMADSISGTQIVAGSVTSAEIKVGTISAGTGIIADGTITNALISNGAITSAKIGNAEIKTANIASGNITTATIADASITNVKVVSLDATKITTGFLSAQLISAGSITGDKISASTISGNNIAANQIDTLQLKVGAVDATRIKAGAITTDRLAVGAVTADRIAAGSITANHIATIGLDAQLVNVYDGKTGQTLVGSGYLKVDGLDVGVVQSDNLVGNGLFLTSSSEFGFTRDNPMGEALLGSTTYVAGGSQVWKINASTGAVVNQVDIPSRKPFDIAIDSDGTYGYVTVQGDNTLVQVDLNNFVLTGKSLSMGMGPGAIKYTGDDLGDMKHFFVMNTDPDDMNIPDSMIVVDAPPMSINGDLYVHHQIVLGNGPYDFVIDTGNALRVAYVTQADQGDIAIIDISSSTSMNWKQIGSIPISAYGTDNYHGGLPGQFGLGYALGGDSSAAYNTNGSSSMSGMDMGGMGGMDMHDGGSYGASTGTLKTYNPHGIALSSDLDTLYVLDYANGELLVVSKSGSAPYNSLTGRHDTSGNSGMSGMGTTNSPAMTASMGEEDGGGPTTKWVRYRIWVGDSPEDIKIINGKIFITLEDDSMIAVIDESAIINAINADRVFYATWNNNLPMNPYPNIMPRMITVGANPSKMKVFGNNIYVSLSSQNQIAVINTTTETVISTFSVGPNPKGLAISPDGSYIYVVNTGGSEGFSFVYPSGNYIGDAYIGLEGMVEYQGAEFWTPDRSNWVYDGSGNIKSSSTIEFRINEPFLNEGGYAKFTEQGTDYQYAQIEQDLYNAVNYSNGNNLIQAVNEQLRPESISGNKYFPNSVWETSPAPIFSIISGNGSGGTVRTTPSASQYTVYYGADYLSTFVQFSGGVVPSGSWVEATYTARNNIYFKPHNGSIEYAIENSSSPNFYTSFEIDEFVPKFVAYDNQQTNSFTPTGNGINQTYSGLQYSLMTNRAVGKTVTSSVVPISGNLALIVNNVEPDELPGITTGNAVPVSSGGVTIPSGNQWVKIDLGATYMVGSISVAHSYGLDRTYHKTKTEVSEDGVNWIVVYDSISAGEYNEKPNYHPTHDHTHYAKFFNFTAIPVRYVRDWANGWTSGDGLTSGSTSDWTEIKAYGDWQVEYNYTYPSNTSLAGQQIATNGKCIVSTDIKGASVAIDIPIEYTTWWYVTYVTSPGYGIMKVEMPSMGMSHFLSLDTPYVNKIAHRHIMPFQPSVNIKQNGDVKAGMHRAVIRQEKGKITLDRFRFEDFQKYASNSLLITADDHSTAFRRCNPVIAQQAKWYIGTGNQSTFGAYDTPRTNPDTGLPDYSVPIKYRMRFRTQLNPTGNVTERGIAYATSAIFETGKQSTHWRRSEAIDSYPAHRIQRWDGNQPHKTGIQDFHLANGAVRGEKILNGSVMDWHISPYAKIVESKLQLNYPTHNHTNKTFLDTVVDFSGNGSSNYVSRADHDHDNKYLAISGGSLGSVNITGNITTTGTVTVNGGSINISGNSPYIAVGQGNTGSTSPTLKLRSQGTEGWLTWNDSTDTYDFKDHLGNYMPIKASGATFTGNVSVTSTVSASTVSTTTISANTTNITTLSATGTSTINTLNVTGNTSSKLMKQSNGGLNFYPNIAYYEINNNLTGGVIIHSPIARSTATMFKVRIHGYNYNQATVIDSTIVGYIYGSSLGSVDGISGAVINYGITDNGNDGLSKYVGIDANGKMAVAIGDYNTAWYFPRLSVDVWQTLNTSDVTTGWTIDVSTTSGFGWKDLKTPTNTIAGGKFISSISGTFNQNMVGSLGVSGNLSITGNGTISGNQIYHAGNLITANYLTTANAASTYATQSSLSAYLTTANASSTYLTQTNASNTYLTISNASSTYATQTSLSNYLTTANAASTYATQASLSAYLTTANAASTYATQSSLSAYLTTANAASTYLTTANAASTYLTQNNASSTYLTTANAASTYATQTSLSSYLTTANAASTYATQSSLSNYLTTANAASTYLTQTNASNTYATQSSLNSYVTNATLTGNYLTSSSISSNYLNLVGGNLTGSLKISTDNKMIGIDTGTFRFGLWKKSGLSPALAVSSGNTFYLYESSQTDLNDGNISGSTILNTLLQVDRNVIQYKGNTVWHNGNFVPSQYLTTANAASTYLTQSNASSTYLTTANASSTYLTITNASSTYLTTANAASTYLTTANAASTYLTISSASSTYATQSSLNSYVTTATLTGNYMTSSNVASNYLSLNGGTVTGATTITGAFNINKSSVHIQLQESGSNKWHVESVGGVLKFVETGISSRLQLNTGNSGAMTWNGNTVWHSGNFNPANYYTTTQTYTTTQIDTKISATGDVHAGSANTFTNANTFSNAGQAIKVAPITNVAAGTKVIQVTDSLANDLFIVDASGNVTVKGNLNVSGSTVQQTATTVSGNQTINGNMSVNGNSTLGAVNTDVVTVNAGTMTLASGTVFKQVGVYNEVHRRPLFGIAGDLQFQTDSIAFENVVYNYNPTLYANPTVTPNATRYYRLYVIYSDDINGTQATAGQKATLRLAPENGINKDFDLPTTWGGQNERRDWYSPYFTDLQSSHFNIQAKLAQSGNNVGIRWIELIAYDQY